jgi:hypothetical protein
MKEEIKPHFGGLWAEVGYPLDDRRLRNALHFFGTMYLVFLGLKKPKRIEQAMYHYVLDDREMSMQQLWGDKTTDMPVVEIKWRFVDHRFLEFVDGKRVSLWEPVTTERLVDEGYPMQLFESLRSHFVEIGSFYTTEALVPDASAFRALRRKSKKK